MSFDPRHFGNGWPISVKLYLKLRRGVCSAWFVLRPCHHVVGLGEQFHCNVSFNVFFFLSSFLMSSLVVQIASVDWSLITRNAISRRVCCSVLQFSIPWTCFYYHNCTYSGSFTSTLPLIFIVYIGWQWRNFFISAVFRHFVGQALRNVRFLTSADVTFSIR